MLGITYIKLEGSDFLI